MKHTLRCHDFGGSCNQGTLVGEQAIFPMTVHEAKIAPTHKGLRPQSPLALSLGLPIRRVLPSPRFALSTILTRNARAFHCVTGSKESLMRALLFAATLLLADAGAGHAALGGAPAQFGADSTTVVSSMTSGAASYTTLDTTLPTGTRVRQYVSGAGIVFAVSWDGPFLPDLQALLGKHFDTMVAESARTPRAGSSQRTVNRPEVVIFSGGHMRAFEGRAWMPAELPAGFSANDIR